MSFSADQTSGLIRRSLLLAPVHDKAAVEAAIVSGADAICLDLEDTVPAVRKAEARAMVREAITRCAETADVLVRINGTREEVDADLDACVWPGLDGVRMPKAEAPADVSWLAEQLAAREHERGITRPVTISLLVESVRGLFASRDLIAADSRVVGINLGQEDFARDLGVEPTAEGDESLLGELGLVLVAREGAIHPLGVLGRRAGEEAVRARCAWLRKVGFRGAATTDPSAIPFINESFTPTAAELDRARAIVSAYDAALARGDGILTVKGIGMVDLPVADRARRLLSLAVAQQRNPCEG